MNVSFSTPLPDGGAPSAQNGELPDSRMVPDRMLQGHRELAGCWARFIAMLPGKLREFLLLRHERRLSYREISAKAGVPIHTVESRIK